MLSGVALVVFGAIAAYAIPAFATSFGNDVMVTGKLTAAGNVGIGTTGPIAPLNVVQTGNTAAIVVDSASNGNAISFETANSRKWVQYLNGNDFRFYDKTNNADRVTLQTGGNVGIGTTNPVSTLDVNGTLHLAPTGVKDGAAEGTIYYDAASKHFFGFNGSAWKQLDN